MIRFLRDKKSRSFHSIFEIRPPSNDHHPPRAVIISGLNNRTDSISVYIVVVLVSMDEE